MSAPSPVGLPFYSTDHELAEDVSHLWTRGWRGVAVGAAFGALSRATAGVANLWNGSTRTLWKVRATRGHAPTDDDKSNQRHARRKK